MSVSEGSATLTEPTEAWAFSEDMAVTHDHSMPGGSPFPPIDDYAFVSDCEVSALVASSGNIEWMCLPRMDGPSVFGAVLDRGAGAFRLGPADVRVPAARHLPAAMHLPPARHRPPTRHRPRTRHEDTGARSSTSGEC